MVPKLWDETIEAHRQAVRGAIVDSAAALVAAHGVLGVTMSRIAEEAGIGRATLYKYFPDAQSVLVAWHERQVTAHLHQLSEVRDRAGNAGDRLEAVLEAYALMTYGRPRDVELMAAVHRGRHLEHAHRHLEEFIQDLLREAVKTGDARSDVGPAELARYCVNALAGAGDLSSKAAVRRLVRVTLAGLRA